MNGPHPAFPLHHDSISKNKRPGIFAKSSMGDEGLVTEDATSFTGNALGQVDIATDAESDAILSERQPGYDRFAESLMMIAGLPLSDADKAKTIRLLLRDANR